MYEIIVYFERGDTTCVDKFTAKGADAGAFSATWAMNCLVLTMRDGFDDQGNKVTAKMYGHAYDLERRHLPEKETRNG